MSLEQALADNTAALAALTAAVLATTKLAPSSDAAVKAVADKTADKAADKPTKAVAGKGKADAPAAGGMTAEELTKAIVKAVGATDKETVLGILKKDFGVSAGKEVTDPAVRQEIADKLATLTDADLS